MLKRTIPSSGEELPIMGLGTWQTFDVDRQSFPNLTSVLSKMHAAGGSLIDSSPMYGKAENVIGDVTSVMSQRNDFFYATKVWTTGQQAGIKQVDDSMRKMKRGVLDLVQIHNLLDWEIHLPQLRKMKEDGKIRYIGITHYTDSSHEELERVMQEKDIDFVQFNYSITARHAEKRLLDAAIDRGVATLINKPLGSGKLFDKVKEKALPVWAKDFGIESWGSFFLKYVGSHPAVTCVIPATGNPQHMEDNLTAGIGVLPDLQVRKKMINFMDTL